MKNMTVGIAALFVIAAPMTSFAAMGGMDMEQGSVQMDHAGMMSMGKLAHEEVVDGVKTTFRVIDIKAKMQKMGMRETHHIMVVFTNAKSGKQLAEGSVTVKVTGPDKSEQVKDLMGMEGGFGSDFTMPNKGKYGVMCKFQLKDGKTRSAKFWYTVK